ncbi:MAG: hypothetical protein SGARI_004749 [Bacillariaceae sp.]
MNYSKFDNIKDDDDDDDIGIDIEKDGREEITQPAVSPQQQQHQQQRFTTAILRDDTHPERYYFQCNGQRVYDFQQDLDQVTIYVKPPPHVTKGSQIKCHIAPHHLKLGLVGMMMNDQWYLNEDTCGTVDVDESTWSLEDDDDDDDKESSAKVICIYLTKANRGTLWDAALKGNAEETASNTDATTAATTGGTATAMNEFQKEQVKKELMLQKFQEENPGFDFRGADFNGSVPDPREFMGGVRYD